MQVATAVSTGSGTPTGKVNVNASTGESCVVSTLSSGTGSCNITFTTTGSRTLSAFYGGDGNFLGNTSRTVTQTVKAPQTVSFTSTAPSDAVVGGATYRPTATASSRQPVTITVDSSAVGICSINDGIVTYSSPGLCVLNANQAGSADFNAAPQVQQTFPIAPAPPPSSPPLITRNPIDRIVAVGTLATFSAAATGLPAPTVQWQVNTGGLWVNIPGAISTTYSFNTNPTDDGLRYRAVFQNSSGSAATSAATLTLTAVSSGGCSTTGGQASASWQLQVMLLAILLFVSKRAYQAKRTR